MSSERMIARMQIHDHIKAYQKILGDHRLTLRCDEHGDFILCEATGLPLFDDDETYGDGDFCVLKDAVVVKEGLPVAESGDEA